jgi:hypothetical protein
MPPNPYQPRRLAAAVIAATCAAFASSAVHADTITVNTDNLETLGDVTTIFQGPIGSSTNGYLAHDPTKPPGITVYQEPFNSQSKDYQGCIMARTDFQPAPNCQAAQDEGKRYKMSATSIGPIDIVFDSADADVNLYRSFGKLSNRTGLRMLGFSVEVGTGVGNSFVRSTSPSLTLVEHDPFGKFPGGLFGGGAEGPGFFTGVEAAEFDRDGDSNSYFQKSTQMPDLYFDLFGNWLPDAWVPTGWLFDDDGNPATDDQLLAWFDSSRWLYYPGYVETEVPPADLALWASQPVTISGPGATTYATWDPEAGDEGLYILTGGGTKTLDEMKDFLQGNPDYQREPGYVRGPIEDLANVNTNFGVRVAREWPQGQKVTMRITPIIAPDATIPPPWVRQPRPAVPIPTMSTIGIVLLALMMFGVAYWRRRRMS